MIALFAMLIAAPTAAPDGLVFRCGSEDAPGFEVHVVQPTRRSGGSYRIVGLEAPAGFERVENTLPERLFLIWRREHNSPVEVEIRDYDPAAGTARYELRSERNPASRLFTPVTAQGSCTVAAGPQDRAS